MGIQKTDLDMRRERIAHEISGHYIGTGIDISGGDRKGPYQVTISYLSRRDLERLLKLIGRPATVEGR